MILASAETTQIGLHNRMLASLKDCFHFKPSIIQN